MDDSGNLLKQYPYVTSQDVDYLREGYGALGDISQLVRCINTARETQQANGREHVLAGPLLDVQSVHVLPKAAHKGRPVFVYGRIHVSYLHISDGRQMHLDIYNRSADDAEYISPTGGYLTLTWPDDNHWKVYDLWMKLDKTTIAVDLYLKIGDRTAPLAVDDILVGDTTKGDFEEVKSKEVGGKLCSATVVYMGNAICYFGSTGCSFLQQRPKHPSGKPAYSSLILDLDLRDFDANTTLIKRKVELFDRNGVFSTEYLVTVDGLTIRVHMPMFSYQPDGCCYESSDSDESDDECVFEDNLRYHHHSMPVTPCASNLVEFYSVLIGRRNLMALNVSGTIEITTDHNSQYLFKSIGDDVVKMEEGDKVLPLLEVDKEYYDCETLELKINLKDVDGKYKNKGFLTYEIDFSGRPFWFNTQRCSVIPGEDGFCALFYSMFRKACLADIEVHFKVKNVCDPLIYGSVVAQYSNFDYSTQFKREYFRSVLFKRSKKDLAELGVDGKVPLARCVVVVPMHSSLILDLDLCGSTVNDSLSFKKEFEIGHHLFTMETTLYELDIKLSWRDVWLNLTLLSFRFFLAASYYESGKEKMEDMNLVSLKGNNSAREHSSYQQELQEHVSERVDKERSSEEKPFELEKNVEASDFPRPSREEPVGEIAKLSYASIVCGPKGKSTPSASVPPPFTKGTPPPPERKPVLRQSNPFSTVLRDYNHQRVDKGFHQEGKSLSVFVKNLPTTVSIQDIVREFQNFGTIKQGGVVLRKGKDVGNCYAVVEFEDVKGVCNALKVSPIKLNGRQVHIQERRQVNKNITSRGREGAGRAGGRGRSFGMGAYQHNPVVMTG
ncbi:hypothetical protein DM860_009372 [Cuscuta australis]|uniref:RRM domain-containing protein n=1 Tax=Cuscuta australis TaxID=267555 RepID=A0A328DAV8_9ASTE|nr:hypothetical protein DM860_009372 [Cuscuta australis]